MAKILDEVYDLTQPRMVTLKADHLSEHHPESIQMAAERSKWRHLTKSTATDTTNFHYRPFLGLPTINSLVFSYDNGASYKTGNLPTGIYEINATAKEMQITTLNGDDKLDICLNSYFANTANASLCQLLGRLDTLTLLTASLALI
ncbi:hypothetical protein CHS0354_038223 [Potamilus streckersoni]|uniref:Uncharacterized protein n=1 Tax=Potamilus streckersoni TaxID=2493646 RepID=A0AAE0T1S5_9BIVA|nr:hypothetical protein CHS0354_038223 [Potamilus streckersoni]